MSDPIKHECGIALIRLLKPLEFYQQKYGSWMYGMNKMYLLMEKQHNRGHDGAGVVSVKFDVEPGKRFLHRYRSTAKDPIRDVFSQINADLEPFHRQNPNEFLDASWAKDNLPFAGEVYLGHLRYGTFGGNNIENVHPVLRENNWKTRNLALAGNFNLTNVSEVFNKLVEIGQFPKDYSDTVTILENIGHFLDEENENLVSRFKQKGYTKKDITPLIAQSLDIQKILKDSSKKWDGGYAIAGIFGHGDSFVMRDPAGIRPAYYYCNDEVAVIASERPVIQTVFNIRFTDIKEVKPGHAVIIKRDGRITEQQVLEPLPRKSCSFERIYFSRGSDREIYQERKQLGALLAPQILKSVANDIEHTVFSFIPNTAESAFYGMVKSIDNEVKRIQKKQILELGGKLTEEKLEKILSLNTRIDKVAIKDIKLRTFISQENDRNDLAAHVYDVTYGIVENGVDNLVIIDDSIVRGTTLKTSILKILDRLHPKKIVIVSSAPQIRYPDCYGIDMANLSDFVAFRAAIELLIENGMEALITEVYNMAKVQQNFPKTEIVNYVKKIYEPFTDEQISNKIRDLLKPTEMDAEFEIIYQTVDNLHLACPNDTGDWYFTGNYPTPGGNKVVNTAYINYIENKSGRAY